MVVAEKTMVPRGKDYGASRKRLWCFVEKSMVLKTQIPCYYRVLSIRNQVDNQVDNQVLIKLSIMNAKSETFRIGQIDRQIDKKVIHESCYSRTICHLTVYE